MNAFFGYLAAAAALVGMASTHGTKAAAIEPEQPRRVNPPRRRVYRQQPRYGPSIYMPHQGEQEIARRLRQAAKIAARKEASHG